MRISLYIVAIVLFFASCNDTVEPINNEDLIFTNSFPIPVPPYTYVDPTDGLTYTVLGDSGALGHVDSLSSQPAFAWNKSAPSILAAGVFSEPIEIEGGEIQNTDAIIWEWHLGMESEFADTIQYKEGHRLESGTEIESIPEPLPQGHYYWAVWGWGQTGVYILYSSSEFDFYVVN